MQKLNSSQVIYGELINLSMLPSDRASLIAASILSRNSLIGSNACNVIERSTNAHLCNVSTGSEQRSKRRKKDQSVNCELHVVSVGVGDDE